MTDNENKPDQEIIDAAEFDSDIPSDSYASRQIIEDEDEDGDDGIFAPEIARKKKSGSKKTAVAVVMVALLGGGAFYYFNQGKMDIAVPAAVPEMEAMTPVTEDAPPVIGSSETAAPPATDTAPVLEPETITEAPPSPPVDETAPPAETPADTLGLPPASDELSAEPAEVISVTEELTPPDSSNLLKAKISEVGENPQLAPPPVEKAPPAEPEKNLGESELAKAGQTVNAAPKEVAPLKYYDSPKGKALLDIPPPSINPMTEPGQSIIIVHKDRTAPRHVAVIEKGDESHMVEARITSANRASRIGKDDAAIDFYNQAYKKNPNDPRILMGRAVSYQKVGETEKAIQDYKDVLQIDPNNPEALTNLMGLIGEKKPAVALQNLLTLREKYPRNASVAAQLGVAYAQSGNQQDGLKYLNIAAGLQPENPLHYYNMGVISDRMGDREKAIQYYEQSLDVYSVNGSGSGAEFSRETIYDRLSRLRGSN